MSHTDSSPVHSDPSVLYEVRGATALVTMNRPRYRNAQNSAMLYEIDACFTRAVDDPDVNVIVLAGAGDHFSAGHDLGTPDRDSDRAFARRAGIWWDHSDREGGDRRWAREREVYLGLCRRWIDIPKPTIAAVQGACIAGGLMLAWSCDFIVAADDAFFSDPTVKMGMPGVELFAHPFVMNPRAAKEFLFTGDRMGAQRAYELGMVNRVVERQSLMDETVAIAARIAEMPQFGLMLVKQAINQAQDRQGYRAATDAAFGLHQLAHASNAEAGDYLGGVGLDQLRTPPPSTGTVSHDR